MPGLQAGYVEPLLFFYVAYLLYNGPLSNQLIYHKLCLSYYNATFCGPVGTPLHGKAQNIVEEGTAQWSMYIGMARSIPAVPIVVLLGIWSDRVGRKDILMFSIFGEAINAISYFINTCFISLPVILILPGNLISGFCGNVGGVFVGVFAYIADTTCRETRTIRILMTEALGMSATIISSLTGGLVIQLMGFTWLCNLTLLLILLTLVYICLLKESYTPPPSHSTTSLKDKLMEPLSMFSKRSSDDYYQLKLFLLFASFFVAYLQLIGYMSVALLYLFHTPLSFDVTHAGYVDAEGNTMTFFGAYFMSYVLVRRLKWRDASVMVLGSFMNGAFLLCVGLSRTHLQVYLSCLLRGLALQIPANRSALSKLILPCDQGKLTSITGILQTVSSLLSTLLSLYVYQITVDISPAIIMYILASLSIPTFVCALLLAWYDKGRRTSEEMQHERVLAKDVRIEDQKQIEQPNSACTSSAHSLS